MIDPEKTSNVVAHLLSYLLHLTVRGTMEKAGFYVGVPMASALGLRFYYSNDTGAVRSITDGYR